MPRAAHPEVVTPRKPVTGAIEEAPAETVSLIAVRQPVSAHVHDLSRSAESHELGVAETREEGVMEVTHGEKTSKKDVTLSTGVNGSMSAIEMPGELSVSLS